MLTECAHLYMHFEKMLWSHELKVTRTQNIINLRFPSSRAPFSARPKCPTVFTTRPSTCHHGTPSVTVECARVAGIHGDVLNVHTEAFLNPHTGGRRQFCLPRKAHVEFSVGLREVHQRNRWIIHIFSLRTDREQHVSDSSNHSLYLIKLFSFRIS